MNSPFFGQFGAVFPPLAPAPNNGLEELAFADFLNGVYRMGGVSKTLAEMWHEDTNWGPFDINNDVVTGTGLSDSSGGSGAAPVLDDTLAASLIASGFTVIMEAGHVISSGFSFDAVDLPDFVEDLNFGFGDAGRLYDQNGAPNLTTVTDYATDSSATRRVAASFSASLIAVSIDGGAVTSIVPTSFGVNSIVPNVVGVSVIHNITFNPLQNATALPALSAIA